MTATPPDPFAPRTDSQRPAPQPESSTDAQTQYLRAENRALRALLAAQVQPFEAQQPGWLRRFVWWLLSAPGAMLVGWRRWFGLAETARPFSGKRVGYTALTVLYTLAIYGGLVLLVVYWSTPRYAAGDASLTTASPVRVPLPPSPSAPSADALARYANQIEPVARSNEATSSTPTAETSLANPDSQPVNDTPAVTTPATPFTRTLTLGSGTSAARSTEPTTAATANAAAHAPTSESKTPRSTLRVTEIPAEDPKAWVKDLQSALNQCSTLEFLERPNCVTNARKQYCDPNNAWGALRECPVSPTP